MKKQKSKTTEEQVRISDLEERLIHDPSGAFRDHLTSRLFDQLVELKNLRNQGSSPDEYNKIESLILAVSAAGETVSKTWKNHHKKLLKPSV